MLRGRSRARTLDVFTIAIAALFGQISDLGFDHSIRVQGKRVWRAILDNIRSFGSVHEDLDHLDYLQSGLYTTLADFAATVEP